MNNYGHGYKVITEDGVVGTSGKPHVVYGVNIISDGTAGVVNLRNGAAVGADIVIALTGTANKGVWFNFEDGLMFPAGCYCDVDAHVTPQCTIVCEQM
jgi:hypothetical protein